MATAKYSVVVGLQKAGVNSAKQLLIWVVGLFVAKPELLLNLCGDWKNITVGALIVYAGNMFYNWLNNKDMK